jgi:sodium transport system permease protein
MRSAWVVFKKEMKDTLRDKRTWRTMILLPIVLTLLMAYGMPSLIEKQTKKLDEVPPKVALVGAPIDAPLPSFLKQTKQIDLVQVQDPNQQLKDGKIQAILSINPNFDQAIAQNQSGSLTISYDESDTKSSMTQSRLSALISSYSETIVTNRLASKGIDQKLLKPIDMKMDNVATQEQVGGMFMAMIMPMMLGMWTALGGMYAAIDLGAGEKERGTLEALLTTPPSRLSIVIGKYLAVIVSSMISSIVSVTGMYLAFVAKGSATIGDSSGANAANLTFTVPISHLLMVVFVSLTLAIVFSALQLSVSVFARKFKEAQTYISPLSIVVVVPGVLLQFTSLHDIHVMYFFIPLMNTLVCYKEILMGVINWSHIGITFAVSMLIAVVLLRVTHFLFNRETVILRM